MNKSKIISKKQNKNQRGITLIIAITTVTLLLSVSLSVSNIVLREIRISNVSNASKQAFFVADSALNCATYYDTLKISSPDTDSGLISDLNQDLNTAVFGNSSSTFKTNTIKCGEGMGDILGLVMDNNGLGVVSTTFDVDYDNMCARVNVIKTEVDTKIEVSGYNTKATDSGCDLSNAKTRRLIERGLTIIY